MTPQWDVNASLALPAAVTSLFLWDATTIGAFDASTAAIHLVEVAKAASGPVLRPGKTIALAAPPRDAPAATLFPEPVIRAEGGMVYWLRRKPPSLLAFDTSGKLIWQQSEFYSSPFDLRSAPPVLQVAGWSDGAASAGVHSYDFQGRLVGREPSWIKPRPGSNLHTATFRVPLAGGIMEVATSFPFGRWQPKGGPGKALPRLRCEAHEPSFLARVEQAEKRSGLPQPLGPGLESDAPELHALVLAAVALDDQHAALLLNGAALLIVNPEDEVVRCVRLLDRHLPDAPAGTLTSLAAVEGGIAVLERRLATPPEVWLHFFRARTIMGK